MSADPVLDFCRADKAAHERYRELVSPALTLAEAEMRVRNDATLADLEREAGAKWELLPDSLRAVVLNPNERRARA